VTLKLTVLNKAHCNPHILTLPLVTQKSFRQTVPYVLRVRLNPLVKLPLKVFRPNRNQNGCTKYASIDGLNRSSGFELCYFADRQM
jgi:hypothetical protein